MGQWDGVAIVGVGESELGRLLHKSALQLHQEAAKAALEDAGLTLRDVDGVFAAGIAWMPSMATAEYMGIRPRFTDGTSTGGSSFVIHVEHAAAAIKAGLCSVALITHGETGWSNRKRKLKAFWEHGDYNWPETQYEDPFGPVGDVGRYAMAAARHMYEYGTTHEQLAEIAVAARRWAQLNPKALMRTPLTIADVLQSRLICYPLHLLDCCLVTDGGGAIVLTSEDRARDCKKRPIKILGSGEGHTHNIISQMPSLTTTGAVESGKRAFAMAGLTPQDIDVAEIYDSFTITVLITLEDLGFCKKGEGGAFVANQRTAPGGTFLLNTNGGGLSYTHTGMYGVFAVIEAVRQLRRECDARQVKDAEIALVHGTGGELSSQGTLILAGG